MTNFVSLTIWLARKPSLKRRELIRNYAGSLLFNTSSDICFGYLLESPQRGDSNKYPKHTFYEEIRIKHGICCISFCSLRILYNSKFILMAIYLGTNAVVVTRVHCTCTQCTDSDHFVYTHSVIKMFVLLWGNGCTSSKNKSQCTVELQWLQHLWEHENLFEIRIIWATNG